MNQPPGGIMDFKIEKDIPIPVARNKKFSVTGKRTGKKFTVRKMDGGYRVWRIK